ncbi:hypothetical protein Plhal304r1_c064g0152341 [Plasmopara halstedii]
MKWKIQTEFPSFPSLTPTNFGEDDPELIVFAPLTKSANIKAISWGALATALTLKKLKFSQIKTILTLLMQRAAGAAEIRLRKFQGVSSLTLFNTSLKATKPKSIMSASLAKIKKRVECVYKARPQPADHKVKNTIGPTSLT